MRRRLSALVALALASCAASPVREPAVPGAVAMGDEAWLIAGRFPAGRQPDGNSILLRGPGGALLIDTGRHPGQVARIEAQLAALHVPLVAIVNTHWHLDHVSGNPALKAAHPGVRVYATSAINGALDGFLKDSAANSRKALADGLVPPEMVPDVEGDLATIARGAELRPDVAVDASRDVTLAGRRLSLRVAPHAATERDLWVYDPEGRRAFVGDLVTLPVPFLDTACPEGWLGALGAVASSGARRVVPGHGPPMDRVAFGRWRGAFTRFIACARGSGALEGCSAGWTEDAAEWIGSDAARAKAMADYYGERIRSGKLDGYCKV